MVVSTIFLSACQKAAVQEVNCPPDCNVILITVDTLRQDHMGIYGYPKNTTPNIDKFFNDKTIYEQAYTSAPCTVPAVVRMLTGRLDVKDKPRLAEVLNQSGYNTAAIISQHLFGDSENPNPYYSIGFDFYDIQNEKQKDIYSMSTRNAEEVSQKSIEWLEKNHKKR